MWMLLKGEFFKRMMIGLAGAGIFSRVRKAIAFPDIP